MSDDVKSEGGYTVVPGQIRALSKEGKAWFAATKRNERAAQPKPVPQNLTEGKRAAKEARNDPPPPDFKPRPNRYDSHVEAFREAQAEREWLAVWDRVGSGYVPAYYRGDDRVSMLAARRDEYLHWHRPPTTHRHASWFAFDDTGKVVLSLTCSRERALDLALGYNAAGGRLVLLSPEPVLDDADVADCIVIPDERPPAEPEAIDPLSVFAGDDGLLVRTAFGTVAFERYHGKALTNCMFLDPTRTGSPEATTLGPAHPDDPYPVALQEVLRALADAEATVVHEGPASKLPRPGDVLFRNERRSLIAFTPHGPLRPMFADPKQVREIAKGSKLVRIEAAPYGESYLLRVVRADGLVGLLSGRLDVVQYTGPDGRTVVLQ